MLTNKLAWDIEPPDSLLVGTSIISRTPMQEVSIDFYITPDVLLETPNGLVKLPTAEGLLTLLTNGWPAPRPMTIGLTQLFLDDGNILLVCSELARNNGVSVAKAWPELAEHILKITDITAREQVVFVEHYFSGSFSELTIQAMQNFYLVEMTWRGNKAIGQEWRHLKT